MHTRQMVTNQQLLVSMYIYGSYMDTNNRTCTATILATNGTLNDYRSSNAINAYIQNFKFF